MVEGKLVGCTTLEHFSKISMKSYNILLSAIIPKLHKKACNYMTLEELWPRSKDRPKKQLFSRANIIQRMNGSMNLISLNMKRQISRPETTYL